MCGPKVTFDALADWFSQSRNDENPEVVIEFDIGVSTMRKYLGWLIQTGSCFDKNWKSLQMRMTSVAKYFGISRSGVQFFASLGWLSPLTNTDRTAKEAILLSSSEIEYAHVNINVGLVALSIYHIYAGSTITQRYMAIGFSRVMKGLTPSLCGRHMH